MENFVLLPYALYWDKTELGRGGATATPVNFVSLGQHRWTVLGPEGTIRIGETPDVKFPKSSRISPANQALLKHFAAQAALVLILQQLKQLAAT